MTFRDVVALHAPRRPTELEEGVAPFERGRVPAQDLEASRRPKQSVRSCSLELPKSPVPGPRPAPPRRIDRQLLLRAPPGRSPAYRSGDPAPLCVAQRAATLREPQV